MLRRLLELAGFFLKLGTISFGGPAAHLAFMEDEVVRRRRWISAGRFLDLVGASNLIPGPNAVEIAGHVGYCRAGLPGSIVAGLGFTIPAVAMTLVLAWSYGRYGAIPQVEAFLHGVKPAVLAVVFTAVWRLGRKALALWQLALVGAGVAATVLCGADEVVALLAGSLLGVLLLRLTRPDSGLNVGKPAAVVLGVSAGGSARVAHATTLAAVGAGAATPGAASLWSLGLFFLKVGAVWYGGGYVLLAYLEGGLVGHYAGFGQKELLDAVAIGQLTPGPMLTCATFAGYLIAGLPGALVATAAIVLPSFVFVALTNPLISRLRSSRWASRFLDAVSAASVGLMIAVSITLTLATLVDWRAWTVAIVAGAVAVRWRPSPAWLVLGGAVAGRLLW
ncbi:MAG: chromate efflux transporter [Pirellulales bacterium]|nr:chromate efflux transporter [Pirellulales bacterium]